MKVGIFLPNWLGDLVMATPALRALRRQFAPPHRLVGILRPHLAELLAGVDSLDEQWYFDPRATRPDQRRAGLLRRMREERFDLVVLLTNSFHTALLAWLGGAKERVGYARNGRGLLLTGKVAAPREGRKILARPMVQSYLDLAAAVGCGPESPRLELAVTPPERRLGESIWRRLGLRRDGRVVAIHCGGAYGSAKQWPVEHAAALARLIVQKLDHDALHPLWAAGMPNRPRHHAPGRVSPRIFLGEPAGGPARHEGMPPAVSPVGLHRQWTAARRRRAGHAGDHPLRPHLAGLDREPFGPGRRRAAGDGLHRLREANLSARARAMHARPLAGAGARRSGSHFGEKTGEGGVKRKDEGGRMKTDRPSFFILHPFSNP